VSGDGFAVKTTIAQMGNVARSQLKSQQVHNSGPEHMKKPGEKESRIEKLRETEEAQKSKVDSERKQHGGRRGTSNPNDDDEAVFNDDRLDEETDEEIGLRLDIKA